MYKGRYIRSLVCVCYSLNIVLAQRLVYIFVSLALLSEKGGNFECISSALGNPDHAFDFIISLCDLL